MARKKSRAAVELGRRGGEASAEKLTEEQREKSARKAALAEALQGVAAFVQDFYLGITG